MIMLRQVQYHPSHMAKMQKTDIYGDDMLNKYDIYQIAKTGGVRTILNPDNEVVAIIGIRVVDNVGIVWIRPSCIIAKHAVGFVKLIKEHLERIEDVMQLEKIQSVCYKVEKRVRFLEWLGFEYIGQSKALPEFAVFERVK